VRHVRMLTLCLMALLAVTAVSFAVAGPASARKQAKCEGADYSEECYPEERELGRKEEEKGKFSAYTINQYKYCPEGAEWCIWGRTLPGKQGGFFLLGKTHVELSKPITIQGGFRESESSEEPKSGDTYIKLLPAGNGGETLESPVEPVEKGIRLIKSSEKSWPQALKESYTEALHNNESSLGVKIEVAGNTLYENPYAISTEALLVQNSPVLELPLKARLINPWLERLDGGKPCTVGNDENPIMQYLTAEGSGSAGVLEFGLAFTNLVFNGSTLVDTEWPLPLAARPTGCGGEYEAQIDEAIDRVLGSNGITVISGQLAVAEKATLEELNEEGLGEI
jgi:hypothetical protein